MAQHLLINIQIITFATIFVLIVIFDLNNMSKRNASDISSNNETSSNYSNFNSNQVNHQQGKESSHFICQTFLGPICKKCNVKLSSNSTLFTTSWKTIMRHWRKNKCFSGNISQLNAAKLERSLTNSILTLYNSMKNNPTIASSVVKDQFIPIPTIEHLPYCSRCGYLGSLHNVKRHAQSRKSNCSESDLNLSGGEILHSNLQFAVPRDVLDRISSGIFMLPFDGHTDGKCENFHSITNSRTPNISNEVTITRFLPSHEEIMTSISFNVPANIATAMNLFILSELKDTLLAMRKMFQLHRSI